MPTALLPGKALAWAGQAEVAGVALLSPSRDALCGPGFSLWGRGPRGIKKLEKTLHSATLEG